MSDKKVERGFRSSDGEHLPEPSGKIPHLPSDTGATSTVPEGRDKGKAELLDKFREREERYRREHGEEQSAGGEASSASPGTPSAGEPRTGAEPGEGQ